MLIHSLRGSISIRRGINYNLNVLSLVRYDEFISAAAVASNLSLLGFESEHLAYIDCSESRANWRSTQINTQGT